MPHCYLLYPAAALLLVSAHARAQQAWQPFRPGLSYQYSEHATPGDTTHVLRLAAGAPVAGSATDSLFRFNGRVGKVSASANTCGGRQRLLPDNLFGATLRSQPHAVFVLAAANGRTLGLYPHAPLGQSWATGLPGLTASVTARSTAPVLGSAPDSVVTIQFSDGRTLHLSKSYGLLDGPSLDSYLNGRNARRALTLTALPERGLGIAFTTEAAIYDYQPGDVFQYTGRNYATGFGQQVLCQQYWTQDSILTRRVNSTNDTLIYTLHRRQRQQGYGSPGAPIGFCSTPSTTSLYPLFTQTLRISLAVRPGLTSFFQSPTASTYGSVAAPVSTNAARLAGHPEFAYLVRQVCPTSSPDSVVLIGDIDNYATSRIAVGLGFTYGYSSGIYADDITELTAFRKGTQTWGTFFQPSVLLAARAVQPAPTTTAFPNPFAESLTVSFELVGTQLIAVSLHDALGRQVRTLRTTSLSAGPRQLVLPTAGLPAGVYTLHLQFAGEGRSEVLKVLKAE